MSIPVGVSACVVGRPVRFDGGHKRSRFVDTELAACFDLQPVCPEMAIGMGTPRPVIRQVKTERGIRVLGSQDSTLDVTDALHDYSNQLAAHHQSCDSADALRGFIVCAKSPSCGMERVKVYSEDGRGCRKEGVGVFTAALQRHMPWLPIEEDGRLCDPLLRENFVNRVYALHDFYQSLGDRPRARDFVDFHARYKLMLMSCSPQHYQSLGRRIAQIGQCDLSAFYVEYRQQLMDALSHISNRRLHTNTLMHIQGYFKKYLDGAERQELSGLIHDYRRGEVPLMSLLTLIKHYLQKYPTPYLAQQSYLYPHPQPLKLRYGL